MGILQDKTVLVTGVLKSNSIAFHVARLAQEQGANVVLTSFGRQFRLTEPTAKAVVALCSDWFPATTGEIVHVDGGLHAVGM